jgi:hypothetical protein
MLGSVGFEMRGACFGPRCLERALTCRAFRRISERFGG